MPDHPAFLHAYARPAAGPEAYIKIVKGDGALVWDDLGNRYVDALASLWYCQVGHGRDRIVEAVNKQMHELAGWHTFDRFTNGPAEELTERLRELAPMKDARVFLTTGGSESVDTAIKLARLAHYVNGHPEKTLIVSRKPSYHGVSYGALSATGLPANQEGFGPLLGDVVQVQHDSLHELDKVLHDRGPELAAIIAEPVVGAGGVYPPEEGYLEGLRQKADKHGGFLILDEVICGFGRLGKWFGAQRFNVQPDMVTFAKGVTSGYMPVGGVLVGPKVRGPLESDPKLVLRHGNTYSGHPSACAAALPNLDIIEEENLIARADKIGKRLSTGLKSLVDGQSIIDVRGVAGVWAAVFDQGIPALEVREELLTRGVIARPIGTDVIAFCPPLVIEDADIDQCVEALGESVKAVRA
ncbi:MAG: aspartate aminotransferase family protein [Actinobacteria bacterium]|nr:aspartate aminotransferase family protein [Actinomycetota bacterium]MBV9935989.1 aspartate aminotransferase family protein [Actinomycetota bacterium]